MSYNYYGNGFESAYKLNTFGYDENTSSKDFLAYTNKIDFYKQARDSMNNLEYVNPFLYSSGDINVSGENIKKIFMFSDNTNNFSELSNVEFPIKISNTSILYSDSTEYRNFYGISVGDNTWIDGVTKVQILSGNTKDKYKISNFKYKNMPIMTSPIINDINPEPYARRLPISSTVIGNSQDSSNHGNGYSTWSWQSSKSNIYSNKTFSIDALVDNLTIDEEDNWNDVYYNIDINNGCINELNLHTSRIPTSKITDDYAGYLGYTKDWAGYVLELYYVKEKKIIGTDTILGGNIYKTTYNVYATGRFIGFDPTKYENNRIIYKDLMSNYQYDKKKIWTNVPPVINIELQAGGGPGDSPISLALNKAYHKHSINEESEILNLPGGGSGAYGEFTLYMSPEDDRPSKPQAVFYIGLGGLAADPRYLNGRYGKVLNREFIYNMYVASKSMDGFSSMAIANNISFELEGGMHGSMWDYTKIPDSWKNKPKSGDYIGSNRTGYTVAYNYDQLDADEWEELNQNNGAIHSGKGCPNAIGYIIPTHLINGCPRSRDCSEITSNNYSSIRSMKISKLNPFTTSNNKIRTTLGYSEDYSDMLIETNYGRHGYYYTSNTTKEKYATKYSELKSKSLAIFTGNGGAPSVFWSGGNGAPPVRDYPLSTYDSTKSRYDYYMTTMCKNLVLHGAFGSGGGGGSGVAKGVSSSSNIYDDPWFNFLSHNAISDISPSEYDEPIRGGDGGNGCINIIF